MTHGAALPGQRGAGALPAGWHSLGTGLGAAWGQGQGTACRPVSSARLPSCWHRAEGLPGRPACSSTEPEGEDGSLGQARGRGGEVQRDPALNFRLHVSERLDATPLGQWLVRLEKMRLRLADALLFIRGMSSFVRIGISLRKATRDLPQSSLLRLV